MGGVLWLLLVAAGAGSLAKYSQTAGDPGRSPTHWPAETKVPHVAGRATLVFFAHPHCPCTRASLGELEQLLVHAQGLLSTVVIFERFAEFSEDWTHSDLWRQAEAIPGVQVLADRGEESRRFASGTSGHVVLYDKFGQLQFSGGITAARGHAGDNAGKDALLARLAGRSDAREQTPVFGCSLTAPQANPLPKP